MNKNELEQTLLSAGVPINDWGKGKSKTLAHLANELRTGESRLEPSETGLVRIEKGVWLDIFYINQGRLYKLV